GGEGGSQRGRRRRQRAGRGRGAEQDQARDVHPAPAEPVAERGRGDDAGGEGEAVGVDRPFQGGHAAAELSVDRGQRGDDHQRVQRDHEEGDRRQQQTDRRPTAAGGFHSKTPFWSGD